MNSVAILVSSCDQFFDAWRPFAFFFRKFWPQCPLPVHLITNELPIESSFIRAIPVGPDRGWASNMRQALGKLDASHILYLQEDYFLSFPVQDAQLASDITYATDNDVDALYFRARSQLEQDFAPLTDRFGIVPINSDGRTRCQLALWKRESLLAVLREGESAWEMEARGSERTRQMKILSYKARENAPVHYLMSAIVRGLWTREALAMCREEGIEIAPKFRGVYSPNKWLQGWRRAQTRRRSQNYFRGRATKIPVSLP